MTMSNSLPIPKAPDTPTPPSDEEMPRGLGLDGVTTQNSLNPNALSPYAENYGVQSLSGMQSDFQRSGGPLSPVSLNGSSSPQRKGPFNFQSQPLEPKSPVARSVRRIQCQEEDEENNANDTCRVLDNVVVISTSIPPSPPTYSSSPHPKLLSPYPLPFPSLPSASAGIA